MENSSRYFRNTSCEYFPCHKHPRTEEFNCLFCYCPLYSMEERCGGIFKRTAGGLKCCVQCHLPHLPEHYDIIIHKLEEAACPPNLQLQNPDVK